MFKDRGITCEAWFFQFVRKFKDNLITLKKRPHTTIALDKDNRYDLIIADQ